MATQNTYVSKSGTELVLDLKNNQETSHPMAYSTNSGDMLADFGVGLGEDVPKNKHGVISHALLIKEIYRRGLATVNLNVDDYDISRVITKPLRNIGINPVWVAKYEATLENLQRKKDKPAKADTKTLDNVPMIDLFILNLAKHQKTLKKVMTKADKLAIVEKLTKMNGKVLTTQDKDILRNAIDPQPTPTEETGFGFE